MTPEDDLREEPAYLAYWRDAIAAEVYVFDRPVRTPVEPFPPQTDPGLGLEFGPGI